ncbi:hypothetical protein [Pseudomonas typographi]|uniref:Uncharacterized protein n=1 Tax=Pseudomonas typographi TaxID=2715964 RepID=A0ABR7Z4A9_9PSED|nr:hypothetical protein [Pseudomonas typographi]MBD1552911.1 hypothetical protein [Pseudomonas typographi]MBD1588286.1 hypothetical protein [Pseudomonas typographi]MBD1600257.1 hypothetical protein [Pseudomonas typographi]
MIEARAFLIARYWAHAFWVLRDAQGQWLGELHGLATDRRTGQPVPLGYRRWHTLRAWHFEAGQRITLCRPGQPVQQAYQGEDAQARWDRALALIAPINALDLPYPRGGVHWFGATVNSNSLYATFGQAMGLPVSRFSGLWQPGLANRVFLTAGASPEG